MESEGEMMMTLLGSRITLDNVSVTNSIIHQAGGISSVKDFLLSFTFELRSWRFSNYNVSSPGNSTGGKGRPRHVDW